MEWGIGLGRLPQDAAMRGDALAALSVAVVVLAPDDLPVLSNDAAQRLGVVRPGTGAQQVHPMIRTVAAQVRRNGSPRQVELDLPRRGARTGIDPVGVRALVSALTGPGYASGHVVVEATDVTEAHRVARIRRDFVANVSHELKTPVGALALLSETLVDAVDDPEAARRFAGRILHESQRLARLVKELLELSRLQGAAPLPEPVPVSVDQIISEVLDRAGTAAAAKGIELLPSGTDGQVVFGDEGQLVTAVANLVDNAISYSPNETVVNIDVSRDDESVRIAVRDQGIGIEAKDLDRIFERFYRADKARSRDTGGTGLGLAIVNHVAANHGGRIEVSSTVGVGSTFILTLPSKRVESTEE